MNTSQPFLLERASLSPPGPARGRETWEQLPWTWGFSKRWHETEGLEGKKQWEPEKLSSFSSNHQWERERPASYVLSGLQTNRGSLTSGFHLVDFSPAGSTVRRPQCKKRLRDKPGYDSQGRRASRWAGSVSPKKRKESNSLWFELPK